MFRKWLLIALVVLGVSSTLAWAGVSRRYNDGEVIDSDYRQGKEYDDWVARGDASVTKSPLFPGGVRLAAWGSDNEKSPEYAMASGLYFFSVPTDAQTIRVKISYIAQKSSRSFAGGVWIRRSGTGAEYFPDEGKYKGTEAPLYGDTFGLRAGGHFEEIELSALEHAVNGKMELHVVAEGDQQIDIRYVNVEYLGRPYIEKIVTRTYPTTRYVVDRRPWEHGYWRWYTGPVYHYEWIAGRWVRVRYTYPYRDYRVRYVRIRDWWDDYLHHYHHVRHPHTHYVRWVDVYNRRPSPTTIIINNWTPTLERTRRDYVAARRSGKPDRAVPRQRIRSALNNHKRRRPTSVSAASVGTGPTHNPVPDSVVDGEVRRSSSGSNGSRNVRGPAGVKTHRPRSEEEEHQPSLPDMTRADDVRRAPSPEVRRGSGKRRPEDVRTEVPFGSGGSGDASPAPADQQVVRRGSADSTPARVRRGVRQSQDPEVRSSSVRERGVRRGPSRQGPTTARTTTTTGSASAETRRETWKRTRTRTFKPSTSVKRAPTRTRSSTVRPGGSSGGGSSATTHKIKRPRVPRPKPAPSSRVEKKDDDNKKSSKRRSTSSRSSRGRGGTGTRGR